MPRLSTLSPRTLSGAFAAALLLSSSSVSFAIDASAVAKRFAEFSSSKEQTITYQAIENENGDSFTMKGVSIAMPETKPISIKNIQFDAITENSDGSISIGSVIYGAINFAIENVNVSMDEVAVKNFNLPSASNPDPVKSIVYFSSLYGKNLQVAVDDNSVASITVINLNYSNVTADNPVAMDGEMSGINVDLTSVGDRKFKVVLDKLGYDGKFAGRMAFGGSWNLADGRMEISKYNMQVDNIGTLSLLFTISGYTADLALRLQKAGEMAGESKNPQAATMAMMQELPKLFFESANVSFKDDSITSRVLKMQAAQMGGSADDVAKMVPMMLPMMLGGLGNPAFATMVTGAVGRFVGEPGNITVSAKPEKPIALSEIFGIGMAAPTTLLDTLAVKVTANE